jgi:hypothetical protein
MWLDRNGQAIPHEAVQVSITATVKTVHVVRLIRDEGIRKTVIAEEKYDKPIGKQQLLYCLNKYPQASFAVKEKIYVLADEELPF